MTIYVIRKNKILEQVNLECTISYRLLVIYSAYLDITSCEFLK